MYIPKVGLLKKSETKMVATLRASAMVLVVASLREGEKLKQRLFYTFLFFYVLLDPRVPLYS
jgi:hypothetical protein